MPRRMITDRADAEACLSAFANSGMDLRSWTLAHGVDGRSLRAWQRRLAEPQSQAAEKASIRMVELVTGSGAAIGSVVVRVGRCEFYSQYAINRMRAACRSQKTCARR